MWIFPRIKLHLNYASLISCFTDNLPCFTNITSTVTLNELHLKLTQHSTTCGLITAAINQHIPSLTPKALNT